MKDRQWKYVALWALYVALIVLVLVLIAHYVPEKDFSRYSFMASLLGGVMTLSTLVAMVVRHLHNQERQQQDRLDHPPRTLAVSEPAVPSAERRMVDRLKDYARDQGLDD